MSAATNGARPTREAVEDFIFHEQQLLDDWQLVEWAELYTDDAQYDMASLDSDQPLTADPGSSLFVISDNKTRIVSRAKRLMKKTAHAEYPHSKTRHLTSNVRVGRIDGDTLPVRANFVVYRTKGDNTVQYMGEMHYRLALGSDGSMRIRHKRIKLDLNTLAEQGRLTIIL